MPSPITEKSRKKRKCKSPNSSAEEATTTVNSSSVVGHILRDGETRSSDVCIDENIRFADLYINGDVLSGLNAAGFHKPSPVQLQALPSGKCGLDLVVQAKSGTGKTCVFAVLALEMVIPSATTCQVLVLAPTREIAVQIADVISSIGRNIEQLKVCTFIGGTAMTRPGVCHIAVGTAGRLSHLLSNGWLAPEHIRLLVLDEADQLLDSFRSDVQQMMAALPLNKQIVCTSATYTDGLRELASTMMRSPVHVQVCSRQLVGVTQYVHSVPYTGSLNQNFKAKLLHLRGLLGSTRFNQCMIFTNSIMKAESVTESLRGHFPVECLCGGKTQEQRLLAFDTFQKYKCRVLVATDLAARGLDSPNVSLVVSLDPPPHPHTYLHRVGRAGRFGAEGLSVILAAHGDDWLHVQAISTVLRLNIKVLPQPSLANTSDLETLGHLSPDQLQQWVSSTTHKLSYLMDADSHTKGLDPLEVWKIRDQHDDGAELTVNNSTDVLKVAKSEDLQDDIVSCPDKVSNGNGTVKDLGNGHQKKSITNGIKNCENNLEKITNGCSPFQASEESNGVARLERHSVESNDMMLSSDSPQDTVNRKLSHSSSQSTDVRIMDASTVQPYMAEMLPSSSGTAESLALKAALREKFTCNADCTTKDVVSYSRILEKVKQIIENQSEDIVSSSVIQQDSTDVDADTTTTDLIKKFLQSNNEKRKHDNAVIAQAWTVANPDIITTLEEMKERVDVRSKLLNRAKEIHQLAAIKALENVSSPALKNNAESSKVGNAPVEKVNAPVNDSVNASESEINSSQKKANEIKFPTVENDFSFHLKALTIGKKLTEESYDKKPKYLKSSDSSDEGDSDGRDEYGNLIIDKKCRTKKHKQKLSKNTRHLKELENYSDEDYSEEYNNENFGDSYPPGNYRSYENEHYHNTYQHQKRWGDYWYHQYNGYPYSQYSSRAYNNEQYRPMSYDYLPDDMYGQQTFQDYSGYENRHHRSHFSPIVLLNRSQDATKDDEKKYESEAYSNSSNNTKKYSAKKETSSRTKHGKSSIPPKSRTTAVENNLSDGNKRRQFIHKSYKNEHSRGYPQNNAYYGRHYDEYYDQDCPSDCCLPSSSCCNTETDDSDPRCARCECNNAYNSEYDVLDCCTRNTAPSGNCCTARGGATRECCQRYDPWDHMDQYLRMMTKSHALVARHFSPQMHHPAADSLCSSSRTKKSRDQSTASKHPESPYSGSSKETKKTRGKETTGLPIKCFK